MKKNLEDFEGKVVRFKIRSTMRLSKRYYYSQTGLVKKIKFQWASRSRQYSKVAIHTRDDYWPRDYIDMRTVKELPKEEQIIWKLEHNI